MINSKDYKVYLFSDLVTVSLGCALTALSFCTEDLSAIYQPKLLYFSERKFIPQMLCFILANSQGHTSIHS